MMAKKTRKNAPKRRARKPGWWEKQKLAPDLARMYAGQPTGFESDAFSDFAFWLDEAELRDPALRVVQKADKTEDVTLVIDFVRSSRLSAWGHEVIADYLYRQLVHKRTPIYERTVPVSRLLLANDRVSALVTDRGLSVAAAIEQVSEHDGIPVNTLNKFRRGQHTSSGRMKKNRLPSPKTRA